MMQERSLVSELSSQVDQCDPNTTVLFQPPANVVRKRWDPKTQKNLLIARPATRSEFQAWEIEKMVREAPKVEAPKIPDDGEETNPLPMSLRHPPRYPTERAAVAYKQWPARPGTAAAAHGRRNTTRGSPAFGATVNASYENPPTVPAATFSMWVNSAASTDNTGGGGGGGGGGVGGSTVRLTHAPISATQYVSRQQKRRPVSAPPSATAAAAASGGGSSTMRRTAGGGGSGGDAIAPAWRRSHFIASTGGITGEPTKATSWAEVKMRQKRTSRQGGQHGGVLGDNAVKGNNDGFGASSSRRGGGGSRPATARARFHRKEDPAAGGFGGGGGGGSGGGEGVVAGAGAKENRLGHSRARPASARPAAAASHHGPSSSSSSSHAHGAHSNRVRAGTGRGGGGMPVDEDLVAELAAARKAKVKVKPPAPAANKTQGVLNAIAASLGGGGRGGGGEGAAPPAPEPEGFKDGFRVQEIIPRAGHLERMREMARELEPRQQLWVARTMDKTRDNIRQMMA